MKKSVINKYCRKFGFEIHGIGYMQSFQKASFKENAFDNQLEIIGAAATVIFDIGANIGDTAVQYNILFPKATIYAFEPFVTSFQALQQKIADNNRIKAYKIAMAEIKGCKPFFVNHNPDTNSLLLSKTMGLSSDKQVANKGSAMVDVTTIDSFCMENSITQIDILKLDIQGGELAALYGAKQMLEQRKVKLIYTEAYFRQQYVEQPLFHDISKYLDQFGYSLQDIYNPIYGKGSIAWCDAIFRCS